MICRGARRNASCSLSRSRYVLVQAKARKGPILIDVVYDYYRVGGKMPAVAKERAVEVANRLFAAAP